MLDQNAEGYKQHLASIYNNEKDGAHVQFRLQIQNNRQIYTVIFKFDHRCIKSNALLNIFG